jgi:hypothetical protein
MIFVSGTEIIRASKVSTEPGDRPDYSGMISKVVVASAGLGQEGYWATTMLTINPGEEMWFTVERGFSLEEEYVPKNKVFYLDEFTVTASDNVLIRIGIGVQERGNPVIRAIGWSFGYGFATLQPKRAYAFMQDTRPAYFIRNEGNVPISVAINIYGVVEPIL